MRLNKMLAQLLEAPDPELWDRWYEKHRRQADGVTDEALRLVQVAATLADYLTTRTCGGAHAQAVTRSKQTLKKVCKAVGFSYP